MGVLLSQAAVAAALQRKAEWDAQGVKTPLKASFLTIDRQPEYIHATLKSFLEQDPLAALLLPVNLIVGTTHADYVRPYEEMGLARIFAASEQEARIMEIFPVPDDRRVHYKTVFNYWRSLFLGLAAEDKLLLFEDDVSFTSNWLQKFTVLAKGAHGIKPDDFVLSLYSPLQIEPGPPGFIEMEAVNFYGAQGIYYPPQVRRKIASYVEANGVRLYTKANDLLLRDYCVTRECPLAVLRPSLIQHEGMITTGLSPHPTKGHRAPSFIP
ncbi:MAG: hypothetical protein PW734_06430 [Verrucomicrobium sp.]|nr:hypothetical protein [Verrucomicrobium sp.]